MVTALFVTWNGGGNLPPALGIARELLRRGGAARFLGGAAQRARIEAAGFRFSPVTRGLDYDATAPRSTLRAIGALTACFADRGIGEDAAAAARAEPTDVVIVDCLLAGAARGVLRAGLPTVSLVHSLWSYFDRQSRGPIGGIVRLRGASMATALRGSGLTLVAARADFEPDAATPDGVEHIGAVWEGTPVPAAPATARPRVLVSFSTTAFPGQKRALQSTLDALAGLDIEVLVTTGPAIDPAELRAPANTAVHSYLDHAEVLPTTSLVIGHGGHSTAVRALGHGIPLLIMPMHPLMDQPAIGEAIARLCAGRTLPKTAEPARIRDAVRGLLAAGPEREGAALLGAAIRQRDGAAAAVDLLEGFAARPSAHPRPA